jgi:Na+-driven multidrug efflux pump
MVGQRSPATIVAKTGISFNLVFIAALFLTVLCLGTAVFLVFYGPQSDQQKQLGETCAKGFMLGLGAIFGLIGGKALP